jgi:hypothetical protein
VNYCLALRWRPRDILKRCRVVITHIFSRPGIRHLSPLLSRITGCSIRYNHNLTHLACQYIFSVKIFSSEAST